MESPGTETCETGGSFVTVTTLGGIYSWIAGMGPSFVYIRYFQELRKVKLLMSVDMRYLHLSRILNPVGTSGKEEARVYY